MNLKLKKIHYLLLGWISVVSIVSKGRKVNIFVVERNNFTSKALKKKMYLELHISKHNIHQSLSYWFYFSGEP